MKEPRYNFYYRVVLNYDGYPKRTGKTLLKYYKKLHQVRQLMNLGEISELAPSTDECITYSDNQYDPKKGFTKLDSIYAWARFHYIDYIYVYENQTWYCCKVDLNDYFAPIKEILA